MNLTLYSHRYAREILEHPKYAVAWNEVRAVLGDAPLFSYRGKSQSNTRLHVVQQVMNTYFDCRFAIDLGWEYHPLATTLEDFGLVAHYRKRFDDLSIQAEVQFGDMSRWYGDIFRFQTAGTHRLSQLGLSVVPMGSLARLTDPNVVTYERAFRELPFKELSITLPVLLVGLQPGKTTRIVDLRQCAFQNGIRDIVGKGKDENRWRIVHAYLRGIEMKHVGPESETGPMLLAPDEDEE